jgi:ABC-type glycerol-3-phosphate transport system substrate-binding protein
MEFPGKGFPWLSLWNIFMNSSSKNKVAAWSWIKEYTSEKNALRFFKEYGIGSVYESTYKDAEVLAKHGHDVPNAMKNFERAKNPPLSGEAQDFFAATIGEVITGQIEPQAAVEKINAKWATLAVPPATLESAKRNGLQADQASSAAPAEPAAVTPGKITVSYMASGTYDKAAEEVAKELKDKGLEVTIAAFPWAVLRQNNTNQLIAGTGEYDAMSGSYYLADVYKFMQPIDEYIAKDNAGAGMIKGIMQKSEWSEGKQIGMPFGIDAYGVIYRADLFKDAGIDPKFATWAEFVAGAKALKEKLPKDVAPFVYAGGAAEQGPALFFGEYDGTYINKDGKFELDPAKAAAAFQVYKDSDAYASEGSKAFSVDESNAVFLDGKAAMIIGWPSFLRAAADDPAKSKVVGKWAQMEFPGKGFPWLSLWNIFMNSSSKNKDAAWSWIKEYTSEKNALRFFKEYGIGSVYESTYKDAEVLAKHGHDVPNAMKNFERAKNPPLSGEAQDFFAATIGEVITGQIEPQAAVEKINAKWATLAVPPATLESAQRNGLQAK